MPTNTVTHATVGETRKRVISLMNMTISSFLNCSMAIAKTTFRVQNYGSGPDLESVRQSQDKLWTLNLELASPIYAFTAPGIAHSDAICRALAAWSVDTWATSLAHVQHIDLQRLVHVAEIIVKRPLGEGTVVGEFIDQ